MDLGEGSEGLKPPFSGEFYKRLMRKNTEVNSEMLFSGPLFPGLGCQPPFFRFLDPSAHVVCMLYTEEH